FTRLGEGTPRTSEFRVLASTQKDLDAASRDGQFRRDLYFRLAALELTVPPLRERAEDVPLLAQHFASRREGAALSEADFAMMTAYRWPGNVRELENLVERATTLGPERWSGPLFPKQEHKQTFNEMRDQVLRTFEKSYLESLLKDHAGNVS